MMNCRILSGTVFDMLPTIKPGSIDCAVTSPPYWMLRSYLPKGHALKHLELGSEPTVAEYIDNQVKVYRLVREAMADHATLWLNVGDTYTHQRGKRKPGDKHGPKQCTNAGSVSMPSATMEGVEEGSMALVPQRLMLALQDDGWIVRSIVAWTKPAPMPQSTTGWQWRRCRVKVKAAKQTRAKGVAALEIGAASGSANDDMAATWSDCHGCKKCKSNDGYVLRKGSWRPTSSWEPIIMLAKSAGYFCDGEAVKTPAASATLSRNEYTRMLDDPDEQFAVRHDHETTVETANLRDVWRAKLEDMTKEELIAHILAAQDGSLPDTWRIASEGLKAKHYAAFPSALVRNCLLAGTSAKGYCPACGKPWVRIIEKAFVGSFHDHQADGVEFGSRQESGGPRALDGRPSEANMEYDAGKTIGWRPSCKCPPAEPRPASVLDPFCGSGRTATTAAKLGLDFVGVELNPSYVEMAAKIITDDSPLFNSVNDSGALT